MLEFRRMPFQVALQPDLQNAKHKVQSYPAVRAHLALNAAPVLGFGFIFFYTHESSFIANHLTRRVQTLH
jgi:hypothetical protein